MLYTLLYMAATRTQIYLTAEQRQRLDERGSQNGLGLAEMIRQAVDGYLGAKVTSGRPLRAPSARCPSSLSAAAMSGNRG